MTSGTRSSRVTLSGETLKPPSPVFVQASWLSGGDLQLGWTRRSRQGWSWIDEIDAPIGEAREQYRVTVSGVTASLEVETGQPSLTIAAAMLAGVGTVRPSSKSARSATGPLRARLVSLSLYDRSNCMSGTPRLALPLLSAGQAQKEFFHNEALQTLDTLVGGAVEEAPRAAPPSSPVVGACYIVAASPSGAWSGKAQYLAAYTSGGWRFIAPFDGMAAYVKASGTWATYHSGEWEIGVVRGSSLVLGGQQVVGSRGAAIVSPSGGTTADSQARTTIGLILAALRQHGLIDP
jgi:hypothetical protein